MKPKRTWQVTLLLCAALAMSCDGEKTSGGRTAQMTTSGIRELERELGLKFPDGTRVVGSHREDGMDDYLGVKVEMPRAALAGFLDGVPISKDRYADGEGGLLGPDGRGYWDPSKHPKLCTGQAQMAGARALNIGYDDSRPDVAVVFVVSHGT